MTRRPITLGLATLLAAGPLALTGTTYDGEAVDLSQWRGDVVVLKVQPLGGVRAAMRVAETHGLPCVVSSALESSVGIAAGVALAAALPELPALMTESSRRTSAADRAATDLVEAAALQDHGRALVVGHDPETSRVGIGLAIALGAARLGANVVLLAKTSEPHPKLPGTVHTAVEEVEAAGGKGLAVVGDVRKEEDVARAVEAAVDRFGGIDVVVNNASAIATEPTERLSAKKFDLMMDINVRGTFLLTKAALPHQP